MTAPTNNAGPVLGGTEPEDRQQTTSATSVARASAGGKPVDVALRYAAIGWHVFPCRPDKRPHTEHGFKDATTDGDQIRRWWKAWPGAQIGVACGASGLVVLDLDVADDRDGIAALEAIAGARHHGASLIATTPRGGRHLVYRADPARPVKCSARRDGIDVRAAGGYIVAPGPSSPGREWIEGEPGDQLEQVPEWVRAEVLKDAQDEPARTPSVGQDSARTMPLDPRQREAILQALPYIPNDERDIWIRVGMALRSTGAGEDAFDIWTDWSMAVWEDREPVPGAVHPKYREKDQRKQWRSIREYFQNGEEVTIATLFHLAKQAGWAPTTDQELAGVPFELPADLPEVQAEEQAEEPNALKSRPSIPPAKQRDQPFPQHLLEGKGLLLDVVRDMLAAAPFEHPALAMGSTLATLGALLGRRVETQSGLRSNIYAVGVAGAGGGKDAYLRRGEELLNAAGLHSLVGPATWTSGSGLRAALKRQPSHVAFVDEFGKVLQAYLDPRAQGWKAEVGTHLLALFSAASRTWSGVACASLGAASKAAAAEGEAMASPIIEPNLCIFGTTTPSTLFEGLTSANVASGLLPRCLVFPVDEAAKKRRHVANKPDVALVEAIKRLDKATRPAGVLAEAHAVAATKCRRLAFTDEAWEVLDQMEDVEDQRRQSKSPTRELWLRTIELSSKVALIRTVADDPKAEAIDAPALRWAAELVTWSTQRFEDAIGTSLADSDYHRHQLRVLQVIREAGPQGVTTSDLTRGVARSIPRMMRTDILRDLAEGGEILSVERKVEAHGRHGGRKVTTHVAAEFGGSR